MSKTSKSVTIIWFVMRLLSASSSELTEEFLSNSKDQGGLEVKTQFGYSSSAATNSRTKRLHPVAHKMLPIILKFSINSIVQMFDKLTDNKNHQELLEGLKTQLQRIEIELDGLQKEIESIHREMKLLGITAGYSRHEEEIKYSISTLHQYLENKEDEQSREAFFQQAATLPKHLEAIIDGLLGRNAFNIDIIAALRDVTQVSSIMI